MFELTKEILDRIGTALIPERQLVPEGPMFMSSCVTCSGTCKNSCTSSCKGSCKDGCTRTCKGHSR